MQSMASRIGRAARRWRARGATSPSGRTPIARGWFSLGLLLTCLAIRSDSAEQSYKVYRYDPKLRTLGTPCKAILAGQLPLDGNFERDPAMTNRQVLDTYFKRYLLPYMTQPQALEQRAPKRAGGSRPQTTVTDMRRTLIRLLDSAESEEALRATNLIVGKYMKHYAESNGFHPALRVNAVLTLGAMNSRSPAMAGRNEPPVPIAGVARMLLGFATAETLKSGEPVPDALRVAALVGLVRHARFGLTDEQQRQPVRQAMLAMLQRRDPPPGRDPAGHEWIRGLAVDCLGHLGARGATRPVVEALGAALAEEDSGLSFRCKAAEALARIKVSDEAVDATPIAQSAGNFALASCRQEQQHLEAESAAQSPRDRFRSPQTGEEEEDPPKLRAARLALHLGTARQCVENCSTWASPPKDELGPRLTAAIDQGIKEVTHRRMDDTQLLPELPTVASRVQNALGGAAASNTAERAAEPATPAGQPGAEVPDLSDESFF